MPAVYNVQSQNANYSVRSSLVWMSNTCRWAGEYEDYKCQKSRGPVEQGAISMEEGCKLKWTRSLPQNTRHAYFGKFWCSCSHDKNSLTASVMTAKAKGKTWGLLQQEVRNGHFHRRDRAVWWCVCGLSTMKMSERPLWGHSLPLCIAL